MKIFLNILNRYGLAVALVALVMGAAGYILLHSKIVVQYDGVQQTNNNTTNIR